MTAPITTSAELDALPAGTKIECNSDLSLEVEQWVRKPDGMWKKHPAGVARVSSAQLVAEGDTWLVIFRPDQPTPSLPPTVEQIAAELIEHRVAGLRCKCGFRNPLSVNDTESDREQMMWHLAEAVHRLYPTCQPSREALSNALAEVFDIGTSPNALREADAVLALLPGRSEAEVALEARISELNALAEDIDREAAEQAARYRKNDVRCCAPGCNLRWEERQEYGCYVPQAGHLYDERELAEASKIVIEPTYDAQELRARAARLAEGEQR